MPLFHYLNREQIQARVVHPINKPYLVVVFFDPTGEVVLEEIEFKKENLITHLLPLSNGQKTFRIEDTSSGEWAMWIEQDEKWVSCPKP